MNKIRQKKSHRNQWLEKKTEVSRCKKIYKKKTKRHIYGKISSVTYAKKHTKIKIYGKKNQNRWLGKNMEEITKI